MDLHARDRQRMVSDQLVRRGIADERVLAAMRCVPRHRFVEEAFRERADGDHALPIGQEQTISQPCIVALMTSLPELTGREKVLEVGTGSATRRRCWPNCPAAPRRATGDCHFVPLVGKYAWTR